MPTQIEIQRALLEQRKELAAALSTMSSSNKELESISRSLRAIEDSSGAPGSRIAAALAAKKARLQARVTVLVGELAATNRRVAEIKGAIARLEGLIDAAPAEVDPYFAVSHAVARLDDRYPILLFPIRLETRFHAAGATHELWVRVYPDACQTEVPRAYLTEAEWAGAVAFLDDPGYDLAARHGSHRARFMRTWIESHRASTTFAPALRGGDSSALKDIYGVSLVEQIPPPVAHTLPDRFVFRLHARDGRSLRNEVGKAVDSSILLGIDQNQGDNAMLDWLHDFDKAVAAGMGIKIALSRAEYDRGFSRLVVTGIKAAADPASSRHLLEELVENHFHSSGGFALVEQGVATNNSDDGDSGHSGRDQPNDAESLISPLASIPSNTEQGSLSFNDGQWLSQYLGVDDALFQKVDHGRGRDQADARAMNVALFPATLGYFLDEMLDPLLDAEQIASVERFFTRYVLGRGTIPAVRIGKQPYGILPASVPRRLQLQANDKVRNEIVDKVNGLFEIWRQKSRSVKHVDGSAPIRPEDFLEILSLHPTSIQFSQRLIEDIGPKLNAASSTLVGRGILQSLNDWIEEVYFTTVFNAEKLFGVGLGELDRPEILFKLFDEKSVALDGPVIEEALRAFGITPRETFSETEGLRFNYIRWLAEADVETIRTEKGLPSGRRALLFLFLRHAYLLRFASTAMQLKKVAAGLSSEGIKERYRDNQKVDSTDVSKMALLYQADPTITHSRTQSVKDFILQKMKDPGAPPSVDILALRDHRANLTELSRMPKARLERAFVEHLDCCTYRIDAWILGLLSVQLRKQRLQSQTNSQWSKGIYLGTFGYVENVRRKDAGAGEGYILAPSLAHAATGAILKNAQITYAGSEDNPFDIDISSERVRAATRILEGIRNGQGLPELLGYRLERELHDAELDDCILDLRKKYPLAQVPQEGDGGPSETIAVRNVVNGLLLLQDFERRGAAILSVLGTLTQSKRELLIAAFGRVASIFDAIKDLMLAEGVFQAVQGSYERGSAVLDAPRQGKAIPEIEIIRPPRSGPIFTHRFALHFDRVEVGPAGAGSRATLEPSVNAWLKTVLPAPERIVAGVQFSADGDVLYVSLSDLGVEPIDLLYLLNAQDQQAMSALDDLVLAYLARHHTAELASYFTRDLEAPPFALVGYSRKGAPSQLSFFEIAALVQPLRKCVLQARPLTASELTSDTENPVAQITRVSAHHGSRLEAVVTAIAALDFSLSAPGAAPLAGVRAALAQLILDATPLLFMETSFGRILEDLFYSGDDPAEIAAIEARAHAAIDAVKERAASLSDQLSALGEALDPQEEFRVFHEKLRAICGDDVLVLPDLALPAGATAERTAAIAEEIREALEKSPHLLEFAKGTLGMDFPVMEWLAGAARVREKMAAVRDVTHLTRMLGQELTFTPIQLPAHHEDRWLALQFSRESEAIELRDTLLYTFIGPEHGALAAACGLLVDEWTEVIPSKTETAGMSFHYNRPNAEAPQTMLLCTPPELKGKWDLEDVFDSITSTMDMAKARAVEPHHLDDTVLAQLLPATILFSPLYDTAISTHLLANLE